MRRLVIVTGAREMGKTTLISGPMLLGHSLVAALRFIWVNHTYNAIKKKTTMAHVINENSLARWVSLFILSVGWLLGPGCATRYKPPSDMHQKPELDRDAYVSGEAPFVEVTWFGNVNLWITDGEESLLVDGWVTRIPMLRLAIGRIRPNPKALDATIANLEYVLEPLPASNLQAVLVGHTHYDHVLDAPLWAMDARLIGDRADVPLLGPPNLKSIVKGYKSSNHVVATIAADPNQFGGVEGDAYTTRHFSVRPVPIAHGHSDHFIKKWIASRYEGQIACDFKLPARASAFKMDQTLAYHVTHKPTGARMLIYGSAGLPKNKLTAEDQADVLYLCLALYAEPGIDHMTTMFEKVVLASGAHTIVPVHWDNLFREPGDDPKVMRKLVSDIPAAMAYLQSHIGALPADQRIRIIWPTIWMPMRVDYDTNKY